MEGKGEGWREEGGKEEKEEDTGRRAPGEPGMGWSLPPSGGGGAAGSPGHPLGIISQLQPQMIPLK